MLHQARRRHGVYPNRAAANDAAVTRRMLAKGVPAGAAGALAPPPACETARRAAAPRAARAMVHGQLQVCAKVPVLSLALLSNERIDVDKRAHFYRTSVLILISCYRLNT
jgi:hypothetical protein